MVGPRKFSPRHAASLRDAVGKTVQYFCHGGSEGLAHRSGDPAPVGVGQAARRGSGRVRQDVGQMGRRVSRSDDDSGRNAVLGCAHAGVVDEWHPRPQPVRRSAPHTAARSVVWRGFDVDDDLWAEFVGASPGTPRRWRGRGCVTCHRRRPRTSGAQPASRCQPRGRASRWRSTQPRWNPRSR